MLVQSLPMMTLVAIVVSSSVFAVDLKPIVAPHAEVIQVVENGRFTEGPADSPRSLVVLEANGASIGRIPVPEHPANGTFGRAEGQTLLLTARTSLYPIPMSVAGAPLAASGPDRARSVRQHAPRRRSIRGPARLAQDQKQDSAPTTDVIIQDITLKIPTSWKSEPPATSMRLSQFKIPAAAGDQYPTELVISSFRGGGGGVAPNLKRWVDQFLVEGRNVKVTTGTCPQGKYYFSNVSGTYEFTAGGRFPGGKKEPRPKHRSLSVVLETDKKEVYFLRLTGTEKAVTEAAEGFRAAFGADLTKETDYEI